MPEHLAILDCAGNERYVLPSGLTVLVRPMPGYAAAHAVVAARFGSIDVHFRLGGQELTLPAGVAHYLEHKMFEDQEGDAFAKFARTGANANAFTSFDRTCYYFTATSAVDESLDVLLGMLTHPYFTDETVAKEQGIIAQEIKMYEDSPDWRLVTELCQCLYHSHPIRVDIAGTCDSIARITPAMLYDCCQAFYAPANLVLAAAGNLTARQVLDACARAGLDRPAAAPAAQRILAPEPMTLARPQKTLRMAVAKPCFGIGYKEAPLAPGDGRTEALYDLILCCLCGGMSPLYRRLYDEGLVNPGFGGEVLRADGCCCILFTGESDQPDTVRRLLQEEIERLRAEGVDREVFTLCKNEKYGQLVENLENVEDAASQMADFALLGQTVSQQVEMLAGLTAADADAALQAILQPGRAAYVKILPDGAETEE
ncbi:MAG TPA: insulinase family protein [Candidatus Faecalibacterium gallistercoris]|uniref:Insulinase family protein n=1 Tax=Candidatus Faecalibacterium gallistercoris TaxID=2838579 RepID=A0A9D2FEV8_9FIRM|nr:insulinase family protein [Candidatus Faecalibacterium gallistercoris]